MEKQADPNPAPNEGAAIWSDAPGMSAAKEILPVTVDAVSTPTPSKSQPCKNNGGSSRAATAGSAPASSSVPTPPASRPSVLRFPVRIGITWKKGERLEAQDFSNTWYPSKIVEISEEEKAVLIHFEGWNQRYDEWFEMTSERLRPTTRHSERKDKGISKRRRVHPHPIYRPGDEVLAKWKDCKKYPAKISRLMEESTYEVIFYDGITHLIQAINIQPLPEEMKMMKTKKVPPPSPKHSLSFKQVKLNLPTSICQKQRHERSRPSFSGKVLVKNKKSPTKLLGKSKLLPKVTLKRDRELDIFSVVGNKGPPTPTKKVGREAPAPVTITCEATLSTLSEAECLQLFGKAAVGGSSTVTLPVTSDSSVADRPEAQVELCSSNNVGTSLLTSPPVPVPGKESKGSRRPLASRVRKRAYTDTSFDGGRPKAKKKRQADFSFHQDSKQTKNRQLPPLGSAERSKSLDLPGNLPTPPALAPLVPQIFVPSKAFIVEEDHNPFKCPYEGCTKDFRKENLLQYHIKYYHTEPETSASSSTAATAATAPPHPSSSSSSTGVATPVASVSTAAAPGSGNGKPKVDIPTPVGSPLSTSSTCAASSHHPPSQVPVVSAPKRRRRKTDSICSTDSEMSASSKSKSSKRHRNDSEISVTTASPEVAGREHQTDSSRLVQELAAEEEIVAWPDTEEADEEEMALDMVNCTCGQRHHTGLMIQCEVCMCWQHFKCADVKKTGVPPANYVCLICENSPGTRDSCKFIHDFGWERRGELPSFSFKQQQTGSHPSSSSSTSHLTTLASECNDLLTALHGIKRALHSTRRQIKISKEEDDPEFQLWQTDWDNWTKPEEDLALTPRSAEPDLSPTLSTFLFASTSLDKSQEGTVKRECREDKEFITGSASLANTHPSTTSSSIPVAPSSFPSISTLAGSFHSLPPSSLPQLMAECRDGAAKAVGSQLMQVSSASQVYSLSSTPPKAAGTALAAGKASSGATTANSVRESSLAADATEKLSVGGADEEASDAAAAVPATTDLPLSISTSSALTVNTSDPSLPSPSSSLSSLQTNTPPMMLSPAAGLAASGPPQLPQTPSVGRASSMLPSIKRQGENDSLVKDLFPGPAGDAPGLDLGIFPVRHPASAKEEALQPRLSLKDVQENESENIETQPSSFPLQTLNSQPKTGAAHAETSDQRKSLADAEAKDCRSNDAVPSGDASGKETKNKTIDTDPWKPSSSMSRSNPGEGELQPEQAGKLESQATGLQQGVDGGDGGQPNSSDPTHPSSDPDQDQPLVGDVRQQNGKVSPSPSASLYLNVNGEADRSTGFFNEDDEDTQDNDTDTAEESSDPYRNCEHNLLVHVQQVHSDVERQLEGLEARMIELENSEHNNPTIQLSEENILNDVPALKKSLSKLARYLMKVQHFSS
ncbi:PHD finger protein 20-like protein 1 [Plakobranchus ocellatus]|uniref:PHD finger protein 20-like protein 1 n=1 Tax=Plakobranchus ocellatus TaxID=259542 RepID=A0AAV4B6C6_9GAST|nr:PHD finger protein 20-like protein 1 [Plakobranchus ocellatus]